MHIAEYSQESQHAQESLASEVRKLKSQAAATASPAVAEFKLYFLQAQTNVNNMKGSIDQLAGDPETEEKLKAAARTFLEKALEVFA